MDTNCAKYYFNLENKKFGEGPGTSLVIDKLSPLAKGARIIDPVKMGTDRATNIQTDTQGDSYIYVPWNFVRWL